MKRKLRRGFTLIELLISLTLLAVICGSAVSLMTQLTKLSRGTSGHQLGLSELRRLAATFRDTIHNANQVTIDDNPNAITIELADGSQSEWKQVLDGVQYQTTGATNRFDRFLLGEGTTIEFGWDASTSIVHLSLAKGRLVSQDVRVDAALLPKLTTPPAGAEE